MQPTTSNPYAIVSIPAIGRVLQVLWDKAISLGQQTFQISNRRLADAAGCRSASGIPAILRQLADDGHISYDPAASIVMVFSSAPINPQIDQSIDQPAQSPPRHIPDLLKDRVSAPYHESHESPREESCTAPLFAGEDTAFYAYLLRNPDMDAAVATKLVRRRFGTVADFEQDLDRAQRIPWSTNPFFLVVRYWLNGQRIPEPAQEASDVRPAGPARITAGRPGGDRSGDRGTYRAGAAGSGRQGYRGRAAPDTDDRLAHYRAYLKPDQPGADADPACADSA